MWDERRAGVKIRFDTAVVSFDEHDPDVFNVWAAQDMCDRYVWIAAFASREMAEDFVCMRKPQIHYECLADEKPARKSK
jgi:hypothetical protein